MDSVEKVLEEIAKVYKVVDECLDEWVGVTNLQVPILLGMMALKLNWDDKQIKENDGIVRYYIRNHPDWYIIRGVHGGIKRIADKKKKEDTKTNHKLLKEQLRAQIESKIAANAAAAKSLKEEPDMDLLDEGPEDEDL